MKVSCENLYYDKKKTTDEYPLSLILYPIILPAGWKSDEMVGVLAATLDYGDDHGTGSYTWQRNKKE